MHSNAALDAGRLGGGGDLDDAEQIARVDRAAELGGEYQPRVGPLIPGAQLFGFLLVRCLRSIETTAGGIGTVRRERAVLGSVIVSAWFTRAMVAATLSVPASRSTWSQRSANASPLRSPLC